MAGRQAGRSPQFHQGPALEGHSPSGAPVRSTSMVLDYEEVQDIMTRSDGRLLRYSLLSTVGYTLLFFLLRDPPARLVPGILAFVPGDYLDAASALNPLALLNRTLLNESVLVRRFEMVLILALLIYSYWRCIQLLRRGTTAPRLAVILGGATMFSLPLLFLPFLLSNDIYLYIIYGRIAALYGDNPAFAYPALYPNDPFVLYSGFWRGTSSVYGPLWTLFSHGLTLLVESFGGGPASYLALYKLSALGAHLGSATLIWSLLGRWRPQQQGLGTLFYAWNPLALLEAAGSAHNDVLMMTLILLGLWLAQRGRWRLALVPLVGAALVKWIAIVLLPLYAFMLVRQRRELVQQALLAGQILLLVLLIGITPYLPYGSVARSVIAPFSSTSATGAVNSLGELMMGVVPRVLHRLGLGPGPQLVPLNNPGQPTRTLAVYEGQHAVKHFFIRLSQIVFGLLLLGALFAIWRQPSLERLVAAAFWIFLLLLLVATWFFPWYVIWPLALAALLPWERAGRLAATFSASAPLLYAFFPISGAQGSPALLERIRALYVFTPVIVLLLVMLWRALHARRQARQSGGHPAPASE